MNFEFKGTQFDWELYPNTSWGERGSSKRGHVICMNVNGQSASFAGTWTPFNLMTEEEELANAKIIVNSPKMFEQLKKRYDFLDSKKQWNTAESIEFEELKELLTEITSLNIKR